MDVNPLLRLDAEGFLLDPRSWDEATAERLAETLGIRLTEAHLSLIHI